MSTTTDDLEGEPLLVQPVPELDLESVKAALRQFLGVIQQIPPDYSAVQVQGKRLYELARTGQEIVVQSRQVEVFDIEVVDWRPGDFPEIDLTIACGPGTYIRAIARDLGNALNTGGMLTRLIRTASCGFGLNHSLTLEILQAQIEQNAFQPIPPETALNHLPKVFLSVDLARRWCQGQRIRLEDELPTQPSQGHNGTEHNGIQQPRSEQPALLIHHANGRFLGIGLNGHTANERILVPHVVLGTIEPEAE